MATPQELSDFLAQVERRAFKQAVYAVRDEHGALDIVQDSMVKLAEKYADKPAADFPMLFQRILQNTIKDYWRRQKVRTLWTTLFSSFGKAEDDDDNDPLEILAGDPDNDDDQPEAELQRRQTLAIIEDAISRLPARQREAFILRYWEDMDVAEDRKSTRLNSSHVKISYAV